MPKQPPPFYYFMQLYDIILTNCDLNIEYAESSIAILAYTGEILNLHSVALHLVDTS